jgi:glycerol-3-phosphate dehydrogenase (NAD(P)+)
VGYEIAQGKKMAEIVSSMKMVAEGITTTLSGYQLAQKENVEMPIHEQAYLVLYEKKDPRTALQDLMARKLKDE